MLSAIADSTSDDGGWTMRSVASTSVTLCASGERGDDLEQRNTEPPEQEQTDHERNVVGTDEDVVDALEHERAGDGECSLVEPV